MLSNSATASLTSLATGSTSPTEKKASDNASSSSSTTSTTTNKKRKKKYVNEDSLPCSIDLPKLVNKSVDDCDVIYWHHLDTNDIFYERNTPRVLEMIDKKITRAILYYYAVEGSFTTSKIRLFIRDLKDVYQQNGINITGFVFDGQVILTSRCLELYMPATESFDIFIMNDTTHLSHESRLAIHTYIGAVATNNPHLLAYYDFTPIKTEQVSASSSSSASAFQEPSLADEMTNIRVNMMSLLNHKNQQISKLQKLAEDQQQKIQFLEKKVAKLTSELESYNAMAAPRNSLFVMLPSSPSASMIASRNPLRTYSQFSPGPFDPPVGQTDEKTIASKQNNR